MVANTVVKPAGIAITGLPNVHLQPGPLVASVELPVGVFQKAVGLLATLSCRAWAHQMHLYLTALLSLPMGSGAFV